MMLVPALPEFGDRLLGLAPNSLKTFIEGILHTKRKVVDAKRSNWSSIPKEA
jgi:hypothetical protein